MTRIYLTTTIPYVNAAPHLGFALEAVQADVLARHHRQRGDEVRLLTGTDDNSLKNVLAAEAAGVGVREWVDRHAAAFAGLREPLALSYDDFLQTSSDPRHRAGVAWLWRACAAVGDLYRGRYEGWYCVGCESYYSAEELPGGRCPEHGTAPSYLAEQNWFFRLSRYADPLRDAIASGRLRIEPEPRRNEVLALVDQGLRDFSVSRTRERARGWGIPVPDDPGQVVYVWWDALGNYLTSLGLGSGAEAYRCWWDAGDRRIHLVGKGVLRFHAVYWPAMLLSAGLPLPTDILVHDYLTVGGQKISKSAGVGADPVELAARYGVDPVRWWLLREVPRTGDVDFTVGRLVARANADLAGGIGNLVHRVVTMVHRYRAGRTPTGPTAAAVADTCRDAPEQIATALLGYDFRRACAALWTIVDEANRHVEHARPWELAAAERAGDRDAGHRLDASLATLVGAVRTLARELAPFLPGTATAIVGQTTAGADGRLPASRPLITRLVP
ncbi:MAG: methionine--tRNA ligase [Micromonosporaceae bacterium]|nr:methionine--tRNA ligase [Micromonosporaceae bacterium]